MEGGRGEASVSPLKLFFQYLITRDASGRSWLPALLAATASGQSRLGDLVERPGSLIAPVAVPAVSGRLACFEYLVIPPRELLAWFIDHPEALTWPSGAPLSAETVRLRRALLMDDPPGSQAKAQERAREVLATRSPFSPAWWRFEEVSKLDCVLITNRLVLTIEAEPPEPLPPTTEWYPKRSRLVRTIEAAKGLSEGKQWATVVLSMEPHEDATHARLARLLPESAPHLAEADRAELLAAYLGNLTWRAACDAVGLSFDALARATADLGGVTISN